MFRHAGSAPTTTIADCLEKSWDVFMRCEVCTRTARWRRSELTALPRDATLADLASRLRCGDCGAMDGTLSTVNGKAHPGYA